MMHPSRQAYVEEAEVSDSLFLHLFYPGAWIEKRRGIPLLTMHILTSVPGHGHGH